MLKTYSVIVLLFGPLIVVSVAQERQDFSQETVYRGPKLDGNVFLCKSDRVAEAGFFQSSDKGGVTEIASISKQRSTTTWRISLTGSQAEVVAFTGATQTLEAAESFSVHRGSTGVLLTRQDSRPSSQTITLICPIHPSSIRDRV